jgi:hypothetical protein
MRHSGLVPGVFPRGFVTIGAAIVQQAGLGHRMAPAWRM